MTSDSREIFCGWGRGTATLARHQRPRTPAEVADVLDHLTMGIARGLGRAYGDAAQCAGGSVIDCTEMRQILGFDVERGTIRVESGCSIEEVSAYSVPRGWFVPVTPGTSHVTVGGAVAADVHGKNHHRDGSIAGFVEELVLITPEGAQTLSPTRNAELFWATCGGMGLTGVITEVVLRLRPIASASVTVDTDRARGLEECMDLLAAADTRYQYSVAWVDARAAGRRLGRSVVTCGDHAELSSLDGPQQRAPLAYHPKQLARVPLTPPISFMNAVTLPLFNETWYRKAPKHRIGEVQSLDAFFYPLDILGDWNRLYGPRGFTQYQFVVPFGHESVVQFALERLQRAGTPSTLGVLKRFGDADLAPLSFPQPGWTLALDIPLGSPALAEALDDLDRHVAEAGGRVYLAKDGRVRPELIHTMYPRLEEFATQCRRVDPRGLFVSDLSRRIGLLSPYVRE